MSGQPTNIQQRIEIALQRIRRSRAQDEPEWERAWTSILGQLLGGEEFDDMLADFFEAGY